MLQLGLGMQQTTPKLSAQLRKISLFLLRALLTSDDAITIEKYRQFQDATSYICTHAIDEGWEEDAEIREMSLAMLYLSCYLWYKLTR